MTCTPLTNATMEPGTYVRSSEAWTSQTWPARAGGAVAEPGSPPPPHPARTMADAAIAREHHRDLCAICAFLILSGARRPHYQTIGMWLPWGPSLRIAQHGGKNRHGPKTPGAVHTAASVVSRRLINSPWRRVSVF